MGLAAVLGIVRSHKGTIKVYSELNKGSSFKCLFPLSDKRLVETKESFNSKTERNKGVTVLFIDDDKIVRDVAEALFKMEEIEYIMADDGDMGVRLYRENAQKIDIVFLDLTMKNMSGEEVFRELRKINPLVKVVLMTGYDVEDLMRRLGAKGFYAFLQKPFKPDMIIELIKNATK